jgi:hypothetical protein
MPTITFDLTTADANRVADAVIGVYGPLENGETKTARVKRHVKQHLLQTVKVFEGDAAAVAARTTATTAAEPVIT